MSVEATDKRAAENATHPRISLADIERGICHIAYVNGATFVTRADHTDVKSKSIPMENIRCMTICMATLHNGWSVIGKSAPAATENYNEELGRKLAYEDCVRQIWPLMGFQLRDQLHKGE